MVKIRTAVNGLSLNPATLT